MGLKSLVKKGISRKYNMRYEKEIQGHIVVYHDWITDIESDCAYNPQPLPESVDFDEAFVLFCNPAGRLSEHGRAWIAEWFDRFPDAFIMYGDEDVWDGDKRTSPYFKPEWSPDLFDSMFYMGGVVAVRRSWMKECADAERISLQKPDLPRDSKATQRIVRRLVELAGGYERDSHAIRHIPGILFHNRDISAMEGWMRYQETDSGMSQVSSTRGRMLLSIIIPSRDNPDMLRKCIRSIFDVAADIRYEIIVVDNGSGAGQRKEIESGLTDARRSGASGLVRLLYHYEKMEFNFSKMCNHGARKSSGELLLFLNDDVELEEYGCLDNMAGLALRPYTGAVGLKLLYPDAKAAGRIQHVGITNLPMGPVHKLQFCQDEEKHYFGRNRGRHNVLAVTAACMMVEKAKFQEAGGFDEDLQVAFNDVDLCFGLHELGYMNVCECGQFAFHDESYSRGDDEAPEKLARLLAERDKLYGKHPGLEGVDPYYSGFLNRDGLDTRIRPMYETAGNQVQQIGHMEEMEAGSREEQRLESWQDACLMIRVESALTGAENGRSLCLTGWSVVLGDNNACYDKLLVFKQETDSPKYYTLLCHGQYRPDLVENMPDQINVGLCGYMVELGEGLLPAGTYLVGAVARNRVNNHTIANWSSRRVEVCGNSAGRGSGERYGHFNG